MNPWRDGRMTSETDVRALVEVLNAIESRSAGSQCVQLLWHWRLGWVVHDVGWLTTDDADAFCAECGATPHPTLLEALRAALEQLGPDECPEALPLGPVRSSPLWSGDEPSQPSHLKQGGQDGDARQPRHPPKGARGGGR